MISAERKIVSPREDVFYRNPSVDNDVKAGSEAGRPEIVIEKGLDEFHRMGVTLHSR